MPETNRLSYGTAFFEVFNKQYKPKRNISTSVTRDA
jgi:hypothetical protein